MDLINKTQNLEIMYLIFLPNLNLKSKIKVLNYCKEYLKIILVLKFEYIYFNFIIKNFFFIALH